MQLAKEVGNLKAHPGFLKGGRGSLTALKPAEFLMTETKGHKYEGVTLIV